MRLKLYIINERYMRYICKFDENIRWSTDDKANRPYVGLLIELEKYSYLVPLSSPKPKHLKMKNTIDFYKVKEGELGCLNFNNMIPVPQSELNLLKEHMPKDEYETKIKYYDLIRKQYKWLNETNERQELIVGKAEKLYNSYINNSLPDVIKRRCVDFIKLEKAAIEWINNK